jgi:dolichol-phosphate mannosyltransferase
VETGRRGSSREEEPLLSIVVPTYNERENLPRLLERLDRALAGTRYEVVVVDDDSPDGTWRLAEQLSARYPVRVIRRVGRRGLGTAIVEGLRAARGRYVAVIDADLQHPPELLPRMLQEAERGADVVVASRYLPGGGVEGWSRTRLLVSRAAGLLAHLLLPEARRTSDPMSGYWLARRSLVEAASLEGRSWKVLLELLASGPDARVVDVPYVFRRREAGRSKLGPRAMLDYVLDLLRLSNYRVLRFALVGASGAVVNLATVAALEGRLPDLVSYAAGWEVGLTWNYVLHDAWTFRDRRRERGPMAALRYWLRYHAAAGAGFVAYLAVSAAARLLGAGYLAAPLLGIAAGFLANYLVSEHRVWAPRGGG